MILDIFTYTTSFLLLGLPLFIWSYIISHYAWEHFTRKNFCIGLVSWALGALLLWVFSNLSQWNIYAQMFWIFSGKSHALIYSLVIFFLIFSMVWTLYFIFSKSLFWLQSQNTKFQILQYLLFIFIFIVSVSLYYVLFARIWESQSATMLEISGLIFKGFFSIAWYYLLISFLEEWLKSFGGIFFWLDRDKKSYGDILLIWASLGLGFAFFENILYVISVLRTWDTAIPFSLIFFRSIFTVMLHVIASIFLIGAMSFVYHFHTKEKLLCILFVVVGIISHSFFDIALTYGFIGIIFLYTFLLYIIFTYRAYWNLAE